MKSVWLFLLAWGYILPGIIFKSCVGQLPPSKTQNSPSWLAKKADHFWHWEGRLWSSQVKVRRENLRRQLLEEKKRLQVTTDLFNPDDAEVVTEGIYGKLPEVHVDQNLGAIFPLPLSPPHRFSWYQASIEARELLHHIAQVENDLTFPLANSRSLRTQLRHFDFLASRWNDINRQYVSLSQEIRYLESWVSQLEVSDSSEKAQGRQPASEALIQSLFDGDPETLATLREILRPHRVMKRPFLPESLEDSDGLIILPIYTDINNHRFLAEVEGALNTHWNQSSWAKEQGVGFYIRWSFVPVDRRLASGQDSFLLHLARFPKDKASLTTGGLTTYVRGNTLILGPGSIQPRTIAHEIGHLLGFGDCYLRTLTSQGIFGLGILEWDNPFYPDDIMCDNTVGEPRVEVW